MPDMIVSAIQLDFPDRDIDAGRTSPMTIAVSNNGNADLLFIGEGYELTGEHPEDFMIINSFENTPLEAGKTRDLVVAFDPITQGLSTAIVRFTTNDPDEPVVDVALKGDAVDQEISVSADLIQFGIQALGGGPTEPQIVTISNLGTGNLNFLGAGIKISGKDKNEFIIINDPSTGPLEPGLSREVEIVFDPAEVGVKSATLVITTDDFFSPETIITLTGDGEKTDPGLQPSAVDNWNMYD
jgi:hypothetical protein